MKKLLFSLVMMFALVIVAGNAMAQNTTVIQGGTYSYTLSGIKVNTAGTATIAFDGDAAEVVTLVSGFTAGSPYVAPAGTYNAVFTVKYSATATLGLGHLVVTITDGAATGCSNQISLDVTVTAAPTINIAIVAIQDQYCQTTATTTNNTAGSLGSANTITYTVTPTVTSPPASYTWGYTINIPNTTSPLGAGSYKVFRGATDVTSTLPLTRSGLPSTTTSEEYTVQFETTTGIAAQSLTGTTTLGKITEVGGGAATYDETDTSNNSDVVTVKAVPSIGSFQP